MRCARGVSVGVSCVNTVASQINQIIVDEVVTWGVPRVCL